MLKRFNFNNIFLFLFLVLFPFGQLSPVGVVKPLDIVVGLAALNVLLSGQIKPTVFNYLNSFLIVAGFSWIFSVFYFKDIGILPGLLYLIRLGAYMYFFVYVSNFVKSEKSKSFLIDCLILVSSAAAVIGWLQLIFFPDLKPLFIWGWDMHLYRLVGTFFDATYIGIILVLGILTSVIKMITVKDWRYWILICFLTVSLAFTYSRASYLALFAGLMVVGYYKKYFGKLLILSAAFLALVFALPTTKNHSIELLRSFSAVARIENYKSTLTIFEKSPVFGIGFNNMCLAFNEYVGYQEYSSHACSGSDSSILFILATTGVVGIVIFIYMLIKIFESLSLNNINTLILISSFVSVLTHSLFSNSMFYPWVMGWLMILLSVAT